MHAIPRPAAGLALGLALSAATTSLGQTSSPNAGMLKYPDISRSHVVFSYANDLWIVDRAGGTARPLSSPAGEELFARFGPDGETVAFMGNYDGGRDLYVMGIGGGVPERVTHHPGGERLTDFTADGRLIFSAANYMGLGRVPKLFTVDAEGGMPEMLPVPYGASGAISPDGTWLAYTPNNRDTRTWKRYRGGMASDIWLFNLDTNESVRVTDWEGTDTQPMWNGEDLWFLSDAGEEHRLNLWRYDVASGERTQVTTFDEYDVKWPSIGPGSRGRGEIVFQLGAELKAIDLQTRRVRTIDVRIPGDRPEVRPQRVDVTGFIAGGDISPTGARAVVEARGDIWTMPAEHGSPRNLTRTSGVAERSPAWSPDGRWIAYFSDESGEYELYVTQSDGKGETKQLTEGSSTWYMALSWSPDSKKLLYVDKGANVFLYDFETETSRQIDQDPWGTMSQPSWSHDSSWFAWARSGEESAMTSIWLYDVEAGEAHQVTHGMFADTSPAFDRKGDWLYFASSRRFSPSYSSLDTTFIYDDAQVLVAVPLRDDVESPWKLESDEETWKAEKADAEDADDADDAADDAEADDDDAAGGDDDAAGGADDADAMIHPLAGRWEGTIRGLSALGAPPEMDEIAFAMTFAVADDGTITGSSEAMGETSDFDSVTYDASTGALEASGTEDGVTSVLRGRLEDGMLSGSWELVELGAGGTWDARKVSGPGKGDADAGAGAGEAGDGDGDADDAKAGDDEARLEIDLEGFEARARLVPVPPGAFGNLAVNQRNQLLYVRGSGPGGMGIKMVDLNADDKSEKTVQPGVGGFVMSADGKKLLVPSGRAAGIRNAGPGGAAKPVVTRGAVATIDPRAEWRQVLRDAWRVQREFFYVDNLHGVDWDAVFEQYAAMLDDAATRDDVSYIIREMISELNVGHAYYFGGPTESEPRENVGLLGVDFEMDDGAYRIAAKYEGGPWDVDARNPLDAQATGIEVGDYLHAVNGVPVDNMKDPWAAFIGTAGREITVTVGPNPMMDEESRDVVVQPVGSDGQLRYRAWIEWNRRKVAEATDGRVGYIYVPNTGVDGQNDLFRQFYGQAHLDALIIDERWNGGGQIPTRFIELLNRPVTNYWARRDNTDWTWPPDAHQGPKCMLINGLAGSGGDMFPWLFRHNGLGKLIGTRTWGGLVGISGNPGLIDGGYTAVPTFGFYEVDGTWGIEGHGVDPDIEVVDDPALMVDGGDPQLEAAIDLMLQEIEANGYEKPNRPADPNRSGMGIKEADK